MIVGIDAGNFEVKAISKIKVDRFPSEIGEYRDRNLEQSHGENDMVVEYEGKKYFAGSLAKYESEFGSSLMGQSKAHIDCKLRVLIALSRYDSDYFDIVTGQPIGQHLHEEKQKIKTMLRGRHRITVNGNTKGFYINRAEVAAEGGGVFWAYPRDGIVRIIDIGSGTVNCATLRDKRYIDKDSFTLPIGANTTKTQDIKALSRSIAAECLKKWGKDDFVMIAGGIAEKICPFLQEYFPGARLIRPVGGKELSPVYANACGFLRIGEAIYDG